MQPFAVCFSVFDCVAVCYSVFQYVVEGLNVIYRVAVC